MLHKHSKANTIILFQLYDKAYETMLGCIQTKQQKITQHHNIFFWCVQWFLSVYMFISKLISWCFSSTQIIAKDFAENLKNVSEFLKNVSIISIFKCKAIKHFVSISLFTFLVSVLLFNCQRYSAKFICICCFLKVKFALWNRQICFTAHSFLVYIFLYTDHIVNVVDNEMHVTKKERNTLWSTSTKQYKTVLCSYFQSVFLKNMHWKYNCKTVQKKSCAILSKRVS